MHREKVKEYEHMWATFRRETENHYLDIASKRPGPAVSLRNAHGLTATIVDDMVFFESKDPFSVYFVGSPAGLHV